MDNNNYSNGDYTAPEFGSGSGDGSDNSQYNTSGEYTSGQYNAYDQYGTSGQYNAYDQYGTSGQYNANAQYNTNGQYGADNQYNMNGQYYTNGQYNQAGQYNMNGQQYQYNNGYGQSNRGDYSDYSSPNRRSYSSYSGPRNSAPRYSGSSRFDVLLTSGSRDYNSYNRDAPVNSLGFHGDTRPSPSLERELFDDSKHVTEGINFDKVPSISRSIHSLV